MARSLESIVPPRDMWKGSRGTMVNMWLVALKAWAAGQHIVADAVIPDGVLGDKGVSLTKAFQHFCGLEADGGVGPATRARTREALGFDFDAVAAVTPGATLFIQSDGEEIFWTPTPSELVTMH